MPTAPRYPVYLFNVASLGKTYESVEPEDPRSDANNNGNEEEE